MYQHCVFASSLAGRAARCCPKAISALFPTPSCFCVQNRSEELDTNAWDTLGIDEKASKEEEIWGFFFLSVLSVFGTGGQDFQEP